MILDYNKKIEKYIWWKFWKNFHANEKQVDGHFFFVSLMLQQWMCTFNWKAGKDKLSKKKRFWKSEF